MASHHKRTSSGDAPEVYYPPPPPTIPPDQIASHNAAGFAVNHLPTPPADYGPPHTKSDTAAPLFQELRDQQHWNADCGASLPMPSSAQHLHQFPPTPVSPPSSHVFSASSPGYFQTTSYGSQYFPPPPPSKGLSPAPPHQEPINNASHPTITPSPAVTPAVGIQFAPDYAPQNTASPQQYFPPPPASCGTQSSSNAAPISVYYPPPPSSHQLVTSPQRPPASLSHIQAYTPVQPSPPSTLNVSLPHVAPHQYWAGASTQSLPNPSFSPTPSSPNMAMQNDISNSFSNLSLVNQSSTQNSFAATADDVMEHWSKRFVANTLAGRVVRASVKSVTATVQLPMYLSPWGDNNPVTLPNVRRRDAALAVVGHFGAEALAPSALELTGSVLKFGAVQAAERTADDGIHLLAPDKVAAVRHRNGVRSTQVKIKHKLMGSDAVLRYVGGRPALHQMDYSKGWFCPLLYASGRTPNVPRANDFAMAEFHGPGLKADTDLARSLVTILAQDMPIAGLCSTDPNSCAAPGRLLVLLLGMSPCRTQAWSQARIPGEARLQLHLFTGVPAFVVPVAAKAPIFAWSPWTLRQMQGNNGKGSAYSPENQYHELCKYLEDIISVEHVESPYRGEHREMVAMTLWSIIQGSLGTRNLVHDVGAVVDTERSGIAMLRY